MPFRRGLRQRPDRTVDTVRAIVGDRPVTLLPPCAMVSRDWQNQLVDDPNNFIEDYAIYSSARRTSSPLASP